MTIHILDKVTIHILNITSSLSTSIATEARFFIFFLSEISVDFWDFISSAESEKNCEKFNKTIKTN